MTRVIRFLAVGLLLLAAAPPLWSGNTGKIAGSRLHHRRWNKQTTGQDHVDQPLHK